MVSIKHMTSSTTRMVKKSSVFSSQNAGIVKTTKPAAAVMSIFLRPNLSEMRPERKMKPM